MKVTYEALFLNGRGDVVGTCRYTGTYTTRRGRKRLYRNAERAMRDTWWKVYDGMGSCEMDYQPVTDGVDKTPSDLVL